MLNESIKIDLVIFQIDYYEPTYKLILEIDVKQSFGNYQHLEQKNRHRGSKNLLHQSRKRP